MERVKTLILRQGREREEGINCHAVNLITLTHKGEKNLKRYKAIPNLFQPPS